MIKLLFAPFEAQKLYEGLSLYTNDPKLRNVRDNLANTLNEYSPCIHLSAKEAHDIKHKLNQIQRYPALSNFYYRLCIAIEYEVSPWTPTRDKINYS